MGRNVEQATAVVNLDGKNANQLLSELEQNSKKLNKEMLELRKANDKAGFDKKEKELKEVNKQIRLLKQESFDVTRVLKNLNGTNLNDLEITARKLTAELKKMQRGTDEYITKSKQLSLVKNEIGKVKQEFNALGTSNQNATNKMQSGFASIRSGLAPLASAIGITFGVQQIKAFGEESVQAAANFEKAISELSSITGVMGEELEFYKKAAKDLSVANIEGVNITSSAEDIVKAFSLVGSAKPELLSSKEAMVDVTKQAMILAEASGLTLPDAVKSLTDTMNQFGAPAEDAAKYIDALAAGAKYGSASIPEVSEAMVKFGVAAKSSGVNIVESTALIETLASKGLKGAEAGTALRNILLKMNNAKGLPKEALKSFEQAGVNIGVLTNSTLPLEVRLKEMAKLMNTDTGMLKVFGSENVIAAQAVLENIDTYSMFNAQMGETGVAIQQAGINTDNTAAKMKQFKNQIQLIKIAAGDLLAPALLDVAKGMAAIMKGDFSFKGLTSMGNALDRLTQIIQYTPQPIAGFIRGIKSFREAIDSFQNGNIFSGLIKGAEGVANVMTFGLYGSVKSFFVPAKKTVVDGLSDIQKAELMVTNMTDQQLNASLKNLAKQSGMSEANLRKLADTVKEKQLVKTFLELSNALAITQDQFKGLNKITDKYGITARITADSILGIKNATEQELLALFQKQKMTINATKEDWDEYVAMIKGFKTKAEEAEEQNNKLNKSIAEGDDKKSKSMDDLMRALEKLRELNNKSAQEYLSLQEKELAAVDAKYSKDLEQAMKYENDKTNEGREWGKVRLEYEKIIADEKAAINKKYSDMEILEMQRIKDESSIMFSQQFRDFLDFNKKKKDARKQFGLETEKEQEAEEIRNLTQGYLEGYMNFEEYEKLKLLVHKKYADQRAAKEKEVQKKMFNEIQQGFQAAQQIANGMYNLVSTLKDKELADAGDNERKKKEITKKYAVSEFLTKSAQIAANTAAGIMQAFATLPTPAAIIMSGIIGATGIAEEAIVADQLAKVQGYKAGYYPVLDQDNNRYNAGYGGIAQDGMVSKPTLFLAGEQGSSMPEMIISGPTMNNIKMNYPGVLTAIDSARKGKIPRQPVNQVSSPHVFEKSGSSNKELLSVISMLNTSLLRLNQHLDEGIKGKWVYQDLKDVQDNLETINKTFN